MDRKANFELAIAEYDAKALGSSVDFEKDRFISVERDAQSNGRYVKGHVSMRAACDHLARATEEGEPYVPELVIDLDTGARSELDLFAFVAPKSLDAVAVMLPREHAKDALRAVQASNVPGARVAAKLIQQAIDRRK